MTFSPQFLDEIRARVPLAETIGRRVRLVRKGRELVGLCPFHNEKTPSFTINEDKGFFHCFGCGAHGDIISFDMRIDNLTFHEAVDRLAAEAGIEVGPRAGAIDAAPSASAVPKAALTDDELRRIEIARSIWRQSQPAAGTKLAIYLARRGITLTLPPSLRFHPNLEYHPTGLYFLAMVAGIQGPDRRITGIHRTYLLPDASAKAPLSSSKKALGQIGKGAVRLARAGQVLGLAEGIETGLSAMQIFGVPCWAALGSRLDQIALPDLVRAVVIFADNGAAGTAAATKAADVFVGQGRKVTLRQPPEGIGDWNDVLRALQAEQAA